MVTRELYTVMPYEIIKNVCEYANITIEQLKGNTRKREVVIARVLVSYIFLYMGYGLRTIGEIMNRDHASIHHYKRLILNDSDFIVRQQIYGMRIFMLEKGFIIPSIEKFKSRFIHELT